MDHLEEAIRLNQKAERYGDGSLSYADSTLATQRATTYALIALVERLDKVIATDCEGKTGSISVDTGL